MSDDANSGLASWPRYALPRGTTINGYTIDRVLGSGGFGVTYLAHDALGQSFAIKEYYPREFAIREDLAVIAASDEDKGLFDDCLNRFRREARALVRISSSSGGSAGFVGVLTYFTAHGTGFLVMEYVEGKTLAAVLRGQPAGLPANEVRSILLNLAASVGIVHKAGLLHRDIKPANIIVRDDGRLVLIDFGASREAAIGLTRTFTQIYSTGYAPIEQMIGLRQGPFSDIYAIGAVCYHAIGGKMTDAMTRHHAQMAGSVDPLPPAERIGKRRYPVALLKAIDAALAVNQELRPQSIEALVALLEPGEPITDATLGLPRSREVKPPNLSEKRKAATNLNRATPAVVAALALGCAAYFAPWHSIPGHNVGPAETPGQIAAPSETARQEAASQEAARQEALRQEAARQEAARQEAARREAARQEAASQETARQQQEAARRAEAARQQQEAARRAEAARQQQEAARRAEVARQQQEDSRRAEIAQQQREEAMLDQLNPQSRAERAASAAAGDCWQFFANHMKTYMELYNDSIDECKARRAIELRSRM